jgi:hypothetical protein
MKTIRNKGTPPTTPEAAAYALLEAATTTPGPDHRPGETPAEYHRRSVRATYDRGVLRRAAVQAALSDQPGLLEAARAATAGGRARWTDSGLLRVDLEPGEPAETARATAAAVARRFEAALRAVKRALAPPRKKREKTRINP